MNPEQRIFTEIRQVMVNLFGQDKVYDYNPPEGTPYPFVRVGEALKQNRRIHKQDLAGDIQVSLHFWHDNARQRGTFTNMMHDAEVALIGEYGVRGEDINSRVIEDDTTAITLLHGILEINIKRYKN